MEEVEEVEVRTRNAERQNTARGKETFAFNCCSIEYVCGEESTYKYVCIYLYILCTETKTRIELTNWDNIYAHVCVYACMCKYVHAYIGVYVI